MAKGSTNGRTVYVMANDCKWANNPTVGIEGALPDSDNF